MASSCSMGVPLGPVNGHRSLLVTKAVDLNVSDLEAYQNLSQECTHLGQYAPAKPFTPEGSQALPIAIRTAKLSEISVESPSSNLRLSTNRATRIGVEHIMAREFVTYYFKPETWMRLEWVVAKAKEVGFEGPQSPSDAIEKALASYFAEVEEDKRTGTYEQPADESEAIEEALAPYLTAMERIVFLESAYNSS